MNKQNTWLKTMMSFSKPEEMKSEKSTLDRNDWMTRLHLCENGESPLLTRSEWKFITDVRHCLIQKAKSRLNSPFLCSGYGFLQPCSDRPEHMENKLSVLKDNFEQVVNYLKESSQSKEYFMKTYPTWLHIRNMTIIQLRDIGKAVNIESQQGASSRGVGFAVSLIGGLVSLATGATALGIVGSILMGLGTLSSAGISLTESELLQKKIKEAEKILKEDNRYSEKLWDWISDVSKKQEALDTIQNYDVDGITRKIAKDLYFSFKKTFIKEQEMMIEEAIIRLGYSSRINRETADVMGILLATFMLLDRFRLLFNQVLEAFKCKEVLCTIYEAIVAANMMKAAFDATNNTKLSIFHKSRLSLGIENAINIIVESGNANSTSKEAQQIFKAVEKLEDEGKIFKKLFDGSINLRVRLVYKFEENDFVFRKKCVL